MKTTLNKLVLAIGATLLAGSAMSATDSSTFTVAAMVENSCAIGNGAADAGTLKMLLNAGAGTAGTTADKNFDSGQTISVICTKNASATISAGLGSNAVGTVRKMKSGSDTLTYELYSDTGRTTALGSANQINYTGTGSTETDKATIYGRITGTDLAAAVKGTYSDSVALTVNYTP